MTPREQCDAFNAKYKIGDHFIDKWGNIIVTKREAIVVPGGIPIVAAEKCADVEINRLEGIYRQITGVWALDDITPYQPASVHLGPVAPPIAVDLARPGGERKSVAVFADGKLVDQREIPLGGAPTHALLECASPSRIEIAARVLATLAREPWPTGYLQHNPDGTLRPDGQVYAERIEERARLALAYADALIAADKETP